jgi:peptidylprolyl isomerase
MQLQAQNGDTIKVHYTGKHINGEIFDSSKGKPPLEFTLGQGSLIPGFEQGLIGMKIGEKKTLRILPENAYGPYRPELVSIVKLTQFPPHITPSVGLQLELSAEDQYPIFVTITEVGAEEATLDANHPLAGKELVFEIELVDLHKKG